jgi:FtsZ-interacting cell division protein ZipA
VTALIVILVVLVVVLVAAFLVIQRKNRQANIARADQLRHQAATEAQTTIAPAQERAAVAQAQAEEARAAAERAEAEAREAQVAAQQVEATHEDQLRAADRLDPRVDETSDDYAPQVPGTVAQEPTAPADVNAEPDATSTDSPEDGGRPPLLPRRTPGAQEMPGKPIEGEGGGGWFTKG